MLLLEVLVRMRRFDAQSGFTLNEVLIVVVILAILVSAVIGVGKRLKDQANEKLCRSTIQVLIAAIEQYYDYRGSFPDPFLNPSSDPDLEPFENLYKQLYEVSTSRKLCEQIQASQVGNIDGDKYSEFVDPWGEPFDYQYDEIAGQTFPVIVSGGVDRDLTQAADNISSK